MLNEIVGWVRERVLVGSPFCEALYYVVRKEAGLRYPNIPHYLDPHVRESRMLEGGQSALNAT